MVLWISTREALVVFDLPGPVPAIGADATRYPKAIKVSSKAAISSSPAMIAIKNATSSRRLLLLRAAPA